MKHASSCSLFDEINSRIFYEYRHCEAYFREVAAEDTDPRGSLFIKCMALSTAIAAGGIMLSAKPIDNVSLKDVLPGLVSMTRTLSMPIPGVTPRPSEQTTPALPPAPAVKAQKADITKSAPTVPVAKHARKTAAPKYKQTPTSPRHKQIASAIRYANKRLPAAEANLYAAHIMDASKRFSMNPAIVTGVMLIESRGNRFAVSKAGALGLMQIMWNVHERSLKKKFPEIETRSDMFEARNSIMAGTWILKGHLERNNNDLSAALGRYLGMRSSYYHNQVLTYANMAGYNKEWDVEN